MELRNLIRASVGLRAGGDSQVAAGVRDVSPSAPEFEDFESCVLAQLEEGRDQETAEKICENLRTDLEAGLEVEGKSRYRSPTRLPIRRTRPDSALVTRSGPTRMDALVERYGIAAKNLAAHPRSEVFIGYLLQAAAAILRTGNPLPADHNVMRIRSHGLTGTRAVMAGLVARGLISRAGVARLDAPQMIQRRREDKLPEQLDELRFNPNLGRNSRGYRVRDLARRWAGLR